MPFQSLFTDHKQYRLFLWIGASTLFNLLLLAGRLYHLEINPFTLYWSGDYLQLRGEATLLFLVWNLFLAWIPYLITLRLHRLDQRYNSRILTGLLLMTWLCFLPNAPYILTDLIHLRARPGIPVWYDLMVILSFAWTGLMLGYLSLNEVQHFMQQRISRGLSWLLTVGIIALSGFGIFLGRFLRWNSWDVLTNPFQLFEEIISVLFNPAPYAHPLGISALITLFLLLGYLPFSTMMSRTEEKIF
ncbi:MAG: DUF1361 domain-containing protein [Bacteroidota bacterium]